MTFLTVFVLLAVVFIVVTLSVRAQVRDAVTASLESSQRMFAALERGVSASWSRRRARFDA